MELRHYRYFIAVAEELHFRRAAERLHISQPPLSQQIKQLESELGVQLLERSSRRVELTDAGQTFLGEARAVLAAVDRSVNRVQRTARGELGWLRLGFVASAVADVLPPLLERFRATTPDVEFELRELNTEQQVQALASDVIDLGIARDLQRGERFEQTLLRTEPLLAVLPSSHRLADRSGIGLVDLADDDFIALPRARVPRLHDRLLSLCRAAGFNPNLAQEAVQFPTILSLVAASIGVAVVPASVQGFRTEGVVYLPLSDDGAVSSLQLVHRPDEPSPVVARFVASSSVVHNRTSQRRPTAETPA
jgi:DNA-binding transcriptional LysR family regulator